jgi:hypothetical protein
MTTPTWITGFEYGLATPSVNGTGLIDAIVGTCAILSTTGYPHTGNYAMRVNAGAATLAYISRNMTAGRTCVVRFYIYIPTLPVSDRIMFSITTVGHKIQILYDVTQVSFSIGIDGATTQLGTVTVAAGQWYCIDVKAVTSANPWLIDWQIDSVAQTQLSYAHAAEDMSVLDYGLRTVGALLVWYDDIVHSVTAADYPIGPGGTYGLRPNADGVHNNAPNVLENSAGTDIDGTPAWPLLDDDPWATGISNYVRQAANGAANYCEILFADLLDAMYNIIGVDSLLQYASAGTAANTGGCIVFDGATITTLWGVAGALADYSETSAFYKHAIVACSAASWTKALVDGLKSRFGYSDDADPDPYWLAIMLEVGYRFPASSMLMTNAAIGIEEKETTTTMRITNAGIDIEELLTTTHMRITNVAIIVEIILDTKVTDPGPRIEMIP